MSFSKSPIKVLYISSSYPEFSEDWKSVFVQQLLTGLSESAQLHMHYWGPSGIFHHEVNYMASSKQKKWLRKLMRKGGIIHLLRQNSPYGAYASIKLLLALRSVYQKETQLNVLHINWLQNAIPLLGVDNQRPVVISVLGSDYGLLRFPAMRYILRTVMKGRRVALCPNAEWMKSGLKESFGDLATILTVPLGINSELFKIKREWSNITIKKFLVVSRLTQKKIGPLFSWGENIFNNNDSLELHLLGPMQEHMQVPDWIHYHGSTDPKKLLEKWFPQATALITLSGHDEGRPQVMLESMAAGVPIIASRINAHENFLTHLDTGYLVDTEEEFANGVTQLSTQSKNEQIALSARQWVKENIGDWSDCARKYEEQYLNLLERTNAEG